MSESVKCTRCPWRGKRKFQSCDCCDSCSCTGYGFCPTCGGRVKTVEEIQRLEKHSKEVEAAFSDPSRVSELYGRSETTA